MKDLRLGPILDLALDPSAAAGERNNALDAARSILNNDGTTMTAVLAAPRMSPSSTYGQWVAYTTKIVAEKEVLERENARLRKQMTALVAKGGSDDIHRWLAEGGVGPLPQPRNGHYPFAVLKTVCVNRIGERKWQAALCLAMAAAGDGTFRAGNIEDWQRSRRGVPAEIVCLMRDTPHLVKPVPHRWTPEQVTDVEQMISTGMKDCDIAYGMMVKYRVLITSEAVRAKRKAWTKRCRYREVASEVASEASPT
jgi:hypothetical protein